MAYEYAPTYSTGSTSGESAQKSGLGTAQNILSETVKTPQIYPEDYSSQMKGPADLTVSANQQYAPMQQVSGLGANGYQDLQNALQAPIYTQANQAQNRINAQYGANGLYGSVGGGLMSGAQSASQLATQDALSNAVARRYGLQLEDQAQQIDQNKALFASGASSQDQQNAYNAMVNAINQQNTQQGNDFFNKILAQQNQYGLNKQNWQTGIDEINFQRALQLAGQGNSGAAIQAQQDAANKAAQAQQTAALYSGIGSAAGGLMGNYDSSGNSGWNFSDLKFW